MKLYFAKQAAPEAGINIDEEGEAGYINIVQDSDGNVLA